MIKNFIKESNFDNDIILKYKDKLPNKLINIWINFGIGSFIKGYIKVINPDKHLDLLKEVYQSPNSNEYIPIFITGMGDFIVWENNFTVLVNCKKGYSKVIESGFEYFVEDLNDESFLIEELDNKNFKEALQKLGDLDYDECFGYVPLLGLGGSEKVENLQKVKIKEHISLIGQMMGKIK
ncbi:DUF1851 domain-containing protein [Apibacter muscae]|uniref:DUF1851 domain-containing protein n=1 Tax=Apibacter muscae TaxID=2509004 RepID=A0A563DIL4_9FLAO|nr:T6SS immunity protein Tdi1 domain-containing protein [Apibacter muscae]TWP29922.1 DUF1851 domain-containing protein [Apibacter muscae]